MAKTTPALQDELGLSLLPRGTIALNLVQVLGLLSILACTIWYLGLGFGIAAIILGAKKLRDTGRGLAKMALFIGIIGVVLTLMVHLGVMALLAGEMLDLF